MTTPRATVPPQALEAIAFNLCSLHDFDVAFVRYAELFAMTERYEEASAIADKAAREIEALATREEAPANTGKCPCSLKADDCHPDCPHGREAPAEAGEDFTPVTGLWKDQRLSRLERVKAHRMEFRSELKQAIEAVDEEASRQSLAALRAQPPAREDAQPMAWPEKWSGPCTVGNMIANLQTLPPEMPLYSAYHIPMGDQPSLLKVKRPTLSRERVDGNDIKTGDESVPYSAVIWTQPRDFTEATHPAPDALRVAVEALERIATVDMGGGFLGAQACRQVATKALSDMKANQKGGV